MRKTCLWLLIAALVSMTLGAQAELTLDLSASKYELSGEIAAVVVADSAVNTVKESIFGANTSYRGGGYGIFDEETRTFNATLVEKLKNSGVTAVRLPGGIEGDYFHWNESVGPLEERKPQIDCFSQDYPTNCVKNGEPYLVGFGPDEWFELCEMTGTALAVQLNAGNGTPQEAVDFIRYCLEKGVKLDSIAVGNEVCMAEERVAGIRVTKTPEEYVDFYLEVWELMGEELRAQLREMGVPFGCIGIPASHALNKYRDWDDVVLEELNGKTDFIDIHIAYSPYYVSGNNNEQIIKCLLASADRVQKHLNVEFASIEKYAPDVKIFISEHGPLGAIPYSSGMPGGMYLAAFFQTVLKESRVIGADYLPLTNHPAANNLLGYYNEAGENISWDNVVSLVFRMYAEQIGREVLDTAVTGAKTFGAPAVGLMPVTRMVSEGDAAVYLDREAGEGTLFLLNKAYKENTTFTVQLPFAGVEITAVTELYAPNNTMYNSHTRPTMVKPTAYEEGIGPVEDGKLTVTTKPVSLVRIDFVITEE